MSQFEWWYFRPSTTTGCQDRFKWDLGWDLGLGWEWDLGWDGMGWDGLGWDGILNGWQVYLQLYYDH